ncbi:biotin/lipoyl-binding protein [Puteibacter caeruleilacunae]|nr:biotin/lipoyl-binding protein [Puteibacter caeruleilacunae]
MKKFKFTISGHEYDVHLQDIEDNVAEIEVNGTKYKVEIEQEVKTTKTPKLVRRPVAKKPGEGQIKKSASVAGEAIKAPLPGTIVKINVGVGDTISKGQPLLVMEAMKMENNVLAETDGTIKAIKVREGDAVLQDDVLIEIG